MKEEMRQVWYGVQDDHTKIVFAEETKRQLEELTKLELDVYHGDRKVEWSDINNTDEKLSIMQYVIEDREIRKNDLMAYRPPFAILTIVGNRIVRVEFYQGHDGLAKIWDFMAKDFTFETSSYYEDAM